MKTMASPDGTREEALEVEIAEYLGEHGWLYSANDDGYDAERAIWPEDVLLWLSETQPDEYAKVVRTGTGAEQADREALLSTLVTRLDTPMSSGGGTLIVLRRKFSHTRGAAADVRMRQLTPASTLNSIVVGAPMTSGGRTLNVSRTKSPHTRGATAHFRMCQFKPATTLNRTVTEQYEKVRLRVARQVYFSPKRGDNRSIDLVFFVNGL